jgi:hypothetical protein
VRDQWGYFSPLASEQTREPGGEVPDVGIDLDDVLDSADDRAGPDEVAAAASTGSPYVDAGAESRVVAGRAGDRVAGRATGVEEDRNRIER